MTAAISVRAKSVTPSAMKLAGTPRVARVIGRIVLIGLVVLPFALALVPWTQTVYGIGRTVAFNPVERPQFVVSPIEGRIKKWFVVEGSRVRAGDRIVEMVDNDPNLELRLLDEERAILDRLRAAEARVRDIEARIRNLENSRQLAIAVQSSVLRQEQGRVQSADQDLLEARAQLDAAEPNYRRQKELFESNLGGLASKRDLELAQQALQVAQAKYKQAEARLRVAQAGEVAAQDNLSKVNSDTAAMINQENAAMRSAESDVAGVRRDKAQIEVRIARQRAQYVDAPTDGTVLRLLANAEQGGAVVRPGERLAVMVPEIHDDPAPPSPSLVAAGVALAAVTASGNWGSSLGAAVGLESLVVAMSGQVPLTAPDYPGIVAELQIDGNDFPLVRVGDRVRLQFEGWPAAQFVGWPSVAVGTFGGRVYLVDPTADDKGQFRVLVEPDPDDAPWPDQRYMRQYVRTQGWILLNRVTIGWELWRQLNGFPPFRETQEKKAGQILGPVQRK